MLRIRAHHRQQQAQAISIRARSCGVLSILLCAGALVPQTSAFARVTFNQSPHLNPLLAGRSPMKSLRNQLVHSAFTVFPARRTPCSNGRHLHVTCSAKDSSAAKRFGVVGEVLLGLWQAARTAAELGAPLDVTILEATSKVLSKVKISGGGRCNVLHDETKGIKTISEGYPRGKKQLLGALSRFGPEETGCYPSDYECAVQRPILTKCIAFPAGWFRNEGVQLKTEADGRMFPVTDDSQTIVDALCRAAEAAHVTVRTQTRVDGVERGEGGVGFSVLCKKRGDGEETLTFDYLLLSPGSSRIAYKWAQSLGHQIQDPVPSLFTFNIEDPLLEGLAGVSVQDVALTLPLEDTVNKKKKISDRGPVLVTHTGLSGPALLRLSAFGARALFATRYSAPLTLNWLPALPRGLDGALEELLALKKFNANKAAGGSTTPTFNLPRRLWKSLVINSGIDPETRWGDVKTVDLRKLAGNLVRCELQVKGKGVFKEEFVTAGGIALNGVDMKRMESKAVQGLYFAGELLDVDGITGGYNLQSAWSTGTAAGRAVAESLAAATAAPPLA